MRLFWKWCIALWMPIAETIGNFMNRVTLSVFYFVIVLPFGCGVRLLSDPLRLSKKKKTGWVAFSDQVDTLEEVRKQF